MRPRAGWGRKPIIHLSVRSGRRSAAVETAASVESGNPPARLNPSAGRGVEPSTNG